MTTIVVSLPSAVLLHRSIEEQLDHSLTAGETLSNWNAGWANEFSAAYPEVGETFTHQILGFGGTLAAFSRVIDGERLPAALAGAIAAYVGVWIFLSGGAIDRLARSRPVGASAFLATSGRFFPRLLRLNISFGLVYLAAFAWLHPLIVDVLPTRLSAGTATETSAIAWQAAGYIVFLMALSAVTLVADFSRVRLVVEDRRSVIGAISAGTRFVTRRAGRLSWLFLLNILVGAVLARLWLQVAPGGPSATWWALLVGQLYLVARIWARLGFIGSEVVFFQGELAHATYTAPPAPKWPDSASVEAIRNLRAAGRTDSDGRVR